LHILPFVSEKILADYPKIDVKIRNCTKAPCHLLKLDPFQDAPSLCLEAVIENYISKDFENAVVPEPSSTLLQITLVRLLQALT